MRTRSSSTSSPPPAMRTRSSSTSSPPPAMRTRFSTSSPPPAATRARSSSTCSRPPVATRARSSSTSSPPPAATRAPPPAATRARSSSTPSPRAVKRRRERVPTQSSVPPVLAANNGNDGLMLLLFETPSGFAIFSFCGLLINRPNSVEDIWVDFADSWKANRAVWLQEFQIFEDKSSAINENVGVNERLTKMIMNCRFPEQKIAVGKPEYKKIIEERLNIHCLYNTAVMEVMWGIQNCMPSLVPGEKSQVTEADRLPMSLGLQNVLRCYCKVKPEMVNEQIVATASALFECDSVEKFYSRALRNAGDLIKDVSGINCESWTLLKIATALKMIWSPEFGDSCEIPKDEVSRLVSDAGIYEVEMSKYACLRVHKAMVKAHNVRTSKKELLKLLVERAKEAYEAEGPEKA